MCFAMFCSSQFFVGLLFVFFVYVVGVIGSVYFLQYFKEILYQAFTIQATVITL